MSPKKAHEVSRMSEYIHHLTTSVPQFHDVRYIVDVGAGQGYLSRALCDLGFHVLALDGDTGQTEGAKRRDDAKSKGSKPKASQSYAKLPTKGSLTHKTLYINSTTLKDAVSSWIDDPRAAIDRPAPSVLFVALHACGSLTPDIYRAFLDLQRSRNGNTAEKWSPAGAVIVGCCYNLMDAAVDFPLSREFASCPRLTSSHLQLATQMPSHWFDTPTSRASAELAVKKVVYRALLEPFLQASASAQAPDRLNIPPTPSGTEPEPGPEARKARIGRLPDRIYTSFPNFCSHAFTRLGLEPSTHSFDSLPTLSTDENVPMPLAEAQKRLEVLHTLRCILGPCIESLILLDRLAWLRENLCSDSMEEKDAEWDVELVGLFDQALGSARSFALVVVPGEAKPKTGS
ncbi:hypothetical protein DENSPDRAFT_297474 [Dentipellis sp. KUC8613]|nr:hypothetical protein DENSPDRAFT_297474 [Dentipellis sp. KUC8613]